MESDELSGILERLIRDREILLTVQLRCVRTEMIERRLISIDVSLAVEERLLAINGQLLNLLPAHENAPDLQAAARAELERHRDTLYAELRLEQKDLWRDVQRLRGEERQLVRELDEQRQRQERTDGLADAA